jgi:hypothetical protein
METYKTSDPKYLTLWETFYPRFIEDVSYLTKDVSNEDEQALYRRAIRRYGVRVPLQYFPQIGKALEVSLAMSTKFVAPEEVPDFFFSESGLPKHFSKLWQRLFRHCIGGEDLQYGWYPRFDSRDENNLEAKSLCFEVLILRQFFLAFSKVSDVEPEISVDDEVDSFKKRISSLPKIKASSELISYCRNILGRVLSSDAEPTACVANEDVELCAQLAQWETNPFGCHGPGSVANGEKGSDKWLFDTIAGVDPEIFEYYPRDYNLHDSADSVQKNHRRFGTTVDRTSAVAIVPKDFRGHRIICMEPKELQFPQQGLMRILYGLIQSHYLTRNSINFDSTVRSQNAARYSTNATIDLKDASDLLSNRLCKLVLPGRCYKLLTRYRSSRIDVFGEIIVNRSFATMGSALCFPIETLVFFSICLAAMLIQDKLSVDRIDDARFIKGYVKRGHLHVFGDDIVVDEFYAVAVMRALESCGLLINNKKTCLNGLAREACGSWYFCGSDVRIVRFKRSKLTNLRDWLAVNDQVCAIGPFRRTVHAISLLAEHLCVPPYGHLGFQAKMVEVNGRLTPAARALSKSYRWNSNLQRLEFRMPVSSYTLTPRLTDEEGLYAYFTEQAIRPGFRGDTLSIDWKWVSVDAYSKH